MAKTSARRMNRKRANLLKRVVRGNLKAGNVPPGFSRVYEDEALSASYAAHGEALREEVFQTLRPQWPDNNMVSRKKPTIKRWF